MAPTLRAATTDDDRDEVERLAEEFVARQRQGEDVTVEEYAARCPDRADEIRDLFPTIAAMERMKTRTEGSNRSRFGGAPGAALESGQYLGEYRLIRELGRGGMGVVYEAEQESLRRLVAVKVLPRPAAPDDRPAQRFQREARTAANLHHPNIIPVFGFGEHQGLHYFVMQLIAGVGLDRVLHELRAGKDASNPDGVASQRSRTPDNPLGVARALREGVFARPSSSGQSSASAESSGAPASSADPSLSTSFDVFNPGRGYWKGVARIGAQVADALGYAHSEGVLHRDIKPSNLLLDAAGSVWVADFGLAKAAENDEFSRAGDLVGTLRYMAPERFHGRCDARSDVYSLGLTLYEMLTMRPAFEPSDHASLMRQITSTQPPAPRGFNPEIPRDLETVVLKAITPQPEQRYATAAALGEDLTRFVEGRPILARRATPPERLALWVERNRLAAALAGTSIVLGLVATFFIILFLRAPERRRPPRPPEEPADERPIDGWQDGRHPPFRGPGPEGTFPRRPPFRQGPREGRPPPPPPPGEML